MVDLWKAYEAVAPQSLLREAEAVGYPQEAHGAVDHVIQGTQGPKGQW